MKIMRWNVGIGIMVWAALVPEHAWATDAVMPLGAVFLGGAGAVAVGLAGFVCLRLYSLLKGGELGSAWQTIALALLVLAVVLVVETAAGAGWITMSPNVVALIRLLGAAGLLFSFLRFSKVFR
jgi:hypothetical protein